MNNTGMMTNTFRPQVNTESVGFGSFMERNIFYFILTVVLIFLIYLSSTNIEFMVSTGSLRLMFEFSAPYLLFILVFFKERFKI
mgnify:CR=1 FL=1